MRVPGGVGGFFFAAKIALGPLLGRSWPALGVVLLRFGLFSEAPGAQLARKRPPELSGIDFGRHFWSFFDDFRRFFRMLLGMLFRRIFKLIF